MDHHLIKKPSKSRPGGTKIDVWRGLGRRLGGSWSYLKLPATNLLKKQLFLLVLKVPGRRLGGDKLLRPANNGTTGAAREVPPYKAGQSSGVAGTRPLVSKVF